MWAVSITVLLVVLDCYHVEAGSIVEILDDEIEFEAWSEASEMEGAEYFRIDGTDDVVIEEIRKRVAERDLRNHEDSEKDHPEDLSNYADEDSEMELPAPKRRRSLSVAQINQLNQTQIQQLDLNLTQLAGFMTCGNKKRLCDNYTEYCDQEAFQGICQMSCDTYNCTSGDIETCGVVEAINPLQRLHLAQLFGKKIKEEFEVDSIDTNPPSTSEDPE